MSEYTPKTGLYVEIYVGPNHEENGKIKTGTLQQIGRLHEECHISVGGRLGKSCHSKHNCDYAFGQFFDGDPRANKFISKLNELEGICAKLSEGFDPMTDERLIEPT